MKRWTARGAEIVLTELQRRLTLIADLQKLVHNPTTDELHELQPLFEKGLWIFGPEYDRVDFRSNRGMAEVIRRYLKADVNNPLSLRRPDLVATADSSVGAYASDSYDDSGDVIGVDKTLIVELKRGGIPLTPLEVDQARNYALEIRSVGAVQKTSTIICYVLGEELDEKADETGVGSPPYIRVLPVTYDTILRRAHARTFHLEEKLRAALSEIKRDPEVVEVLGEEEQSLFD